MDPVISELAEGKNPLAMILNGGKVRRYHSQGALQAQLVQEHTWRLLAILLHLWPDASRELVVYSIYHDVEEGLVGDMTAPVKRHSVVAEAFKALEKDALTAMQLNPPAITKTEYHRLKCADYLELCITCKNQPYSKQQMEVYNRGLGYVKDYARLLGPVDQLKVADFINAMAKGDFDE